MHNVDHSKNIIEVKDVSFTYGREDVLKNITLGIHKGDYVGLVGHNGSGKTTLLKIILGLLTPSTGALKLFGTDIRHFKEWYKIGYVPQKAVNFDNNFPATVEEVVLMGRYSKRGLFHRIKMSDRKAAREALQKVEMLEFKDRLIGDLSGGQQQRVFIARALVTKPEVIFLDEPTTGIDTKARDEFYGLLRTLNREEGLTLVLVSHDLEVVTQEVMHIACIDRTLVYHGSPQEFLKESVSAFMHDGEVKIVSHHHHHHHDR